MCTCTYIHINAYTYIYTSHSCTPHWPKFSQVKLFIHTLAHVHSDQFLTCWNQSVRYNYSCLTLATLIKMSTKPSPKSVVIESSVKSDILGWVWQRIQEPLTNKHTWLGLTEDSRITGKLACLAWFDRRFKKDRLIFTGCLLLMVKQYVNFKNQLINLSKKLSFALSEGSRSTVKLAC